jgi:hypothetical protein
MPLTKVGEQFKGIERAPEALRNQLHSRLKSRSTKRIKKQGLWDSVVIIKQTPWPESASELNRPSDRRLSIILIIKKK